MAGEETVDNDGNELLEAHAAVEHLRDECGVGIGIGNLFAVARSNRKVSCER